MTAVLNLFAILLQLKAKIKEPVLSALILYSPIEARHFFRIFGQA